MLAEGQRAPDFELPDQAGNLVSLDSLLKEQAVVLYFYPADFTPVCTAEACAFRDRYDELQDKDVNVVGISPQSVSSHARFADQFNLPFPLLFDDRKTVIRAYGVDGPLGFGVRRATYLIGQDQLVKKRVVADFLVASHMALVREALA